MCAYTHTHRFAVIALLFVCAFNITDTLFKSVLNGSLASVRMVQYSFQGYRAEAGSFPLIHRQVGQDGHFKDYKHELPTKT